FELILGMIGFYGVILEFYNPGSLIPGIIGVICLLLAAYAVQLLPLNYAGLALLLLGIGLMVAEALAPSFGILGIGGIIAFSIGGLMLFDTDMEAFQVGIPTIAATATISALLIIATINIALKIRRQRVTTGVELLVGETGLVLADFDSEGQIRVGAEIWHAITDSPLQKGEKVNIIAVDGLQLRVTPANPSTEGDINHG
ncbi:MAG: NfeD family protein, partial [Gammaproteobacteria bacterium]